MFLVDISVIFNKNIGAISNLEVLPEGGKKLATGRSEILKTPPFIFLGPKGVSLVDIASEASSLAEK